MSLVVLSEDIRLNCRDSMTLVWLVLCFVPSSDSEKHAEDPGFTCQTSWEGHAGCQVVQVVRKDLAQGKGLCTSTEFPSSIFQHPPCKLFERSSFGQNPWDSIEPMRFSVSIKRQHLNIVLRGHGFHCSIQVESCGISLTQKWKSHYLRAQEEPIVGTVFKGSILKNLIESFELARSNRCLFLRRGSNWSCLLTKCEHCSTSIMIDLWMVNSF